MMEIKTFEDLDVWKLARDLRKEIYIVTKTYPKEETYRLVDQVRRAAISSAANTAEDFGRFHFQENIQFCRQSRGSLYEIVDHLITSNDEGYLPKDKFESLKAHSYRTIKVMNGYISMLKKKKDSNG